MARPKAAEYDQNRTAIREQAVTAFARLGYASASMADLAKACEVSKATLYHYFENKEALLFESLNDYTVRLESLTAEFSPAPTTDPAPARQQVKHLVAALCAEYEHSHSYHVSLLHDVKFLNTEQRDQIRHQERRVVENVAQLLESAFPGRIDPSSRIATTMALLGMINFTFAWLRPDGPLTHQQFAQIVSELWFNGLQGPSGHSQLT